ncbi:16S rRNA (uracil(1498)-N(3))-methyltransferase [Ruminococcus sp. CLA-AA-H200]|uniref:Ribosomal RNA small subunit methyltransferase E n=1 Tax=Ruminococcus turbiniformis TaxID=2881258 RepID=A0ABS8FZE6_9FIRM|nr:16S rRNA (uracil(1498)-N(3))-methyltransferase [Ruminococcus turbiniformis]MCC2255009.1 16S rRNA (uracil(1498)-N(3))-methyltransferase [Ruminococcus turbiniformis]
MQQFFAEPSQITENRIRLDGPDVNHMKNVLRMKPGEDVRVNDGCGHTYLCCIASYEGEGALLDVLKELDADTELPSGIWLFQGLPKGDKMDWIVQKAVELGAFCVVPFAAKRSVVKLDHKKAAKKQARWQAIAKGAAEQSGRGIIPEVKEPVTFAHALEAASDLDVVLIPYEMEEGMEATARIIEGIRPGQSVGIFIGPEGGFEEEEVALAEHSGAKPVTLGKRILRTETAGLAALSILMYHLESAQHSLIMRNE